MQGSLELHGMDALQPKKKDRLSIKKEPSKQKNQSYSFTSRGRAFKKVECLSSALLQLSEIPRSTYYNVVKGLGMPDKYSDQKDVIQAIYEERERDIIIIASAMNLNITQ